MSPLATLTASWAAVYGYVCTYYLLLYRQRRSRREYLSFGLLSGALSVYATGQALAIEATTLAEAALATKLYAIGITTAAAFFVDFCYATVRRPRGVAGMLAYALGAAILGMVGWTDWLFDDEHLRQSAGVGVAFPYSELAATPVGKLFILATWIIAGYAAFLVLRSARRDRDLAVIGAAAAINMIAAIHDVIVRSGYLDSYYLLEHTAMIAMLGMSYVLLARVVRTQEQLSVRKQELAASYDALRQTQAEIVRQEQLAAVGELSAVIAHEVRNPLGIIRNAAAGLRRQELDDEDRITLLEILDEETDRLNRLMHDLLSYARPIAPEGKSVDVEELVQESIKLATAESGGEAAVEFDIDLSRAPATVYGDSDLLRHALSNVIGNALQAMSAGGVLAVEAFPGTIGNQPAVVFRFRDNGEGMDTSIRDKALDPFFTTRASGTGLGLAIVDRIVRNHGGHLELDSAVLEGTIVTIVLPRERPTTSPAPSPRTRSRRTSRRVEEVHE